MAVSDALLALLHVGPAHGYQLRASFEESTGNAWPLNIGQVYTSLQRLERDGLVELEADDGERKTYRLTPEGRDHALGWLAAASPSPGGGRDETTMRVLLAVNVTPGTATDVIDTQRAAVTAVLQQHTRDKAATPDSDVARLLQLDRIILRCRADLDWLDHAEERLRTYHRGAN